ncbi:MAG: Hsp20 family protein [Candidatus Protistobacter heckmanni]|nr:Hsp20 family protein [Candidatus Protistobacter heckmanni]
MAFPYGRNLLLSTVGFERLLPTFEELNTVLAEGKSPSYPPYNIIKRSDTQYEIEIAVAGFKRDELDITLEGNKLTVTGRVKADSQGEFLHRGIGKRDFTHQFTLAETVVVRDADVVDGLLAIKLENVIPEEKKPHKILIGGTDPLLVQDRKAA